MQTKTPPPECQSPNWGLVLNNEIDQYPRLVEQLLERGRLHEHLDALARLADNASSQAEQLDSAELAQSAAYRTNPEYDPDRPGELSPRHRKMLDDLLLRCEREHRTS